MTDHDIRRLEYAPYHVSLDFEDGEFVPNGNTDLLDAEWDETNSYWCRECDEEFASEEAAIEHISE